MRKRTTINVLVLLLALLFEYVVIEWTRVYGGMPDIVSHVGFAGTIVSIVLAVIAIIYSYYQNFAQRRDSGLLSQQLENLRSVAANLQREGTDLTTIKERIQQALDSATRTERSLLELGGQIASMKARVNEDTEIAEPQTPTAATDFPGSPQDIAKFLVKRAGRPQQATYLAICAASEKGMTTREIGDIVKRAVSKRLEQQGKGNIARVIGDWCDGIVTGHIYLLEDLRIVKREPAESIKGNRMHAIPEFVQAVKQMKLLSPIDEISLDPATIAIAFAVDSG